MCVFLDGVNGNEAKLDEGVDESFSCM